MSIEEERCKGKNESNEAFFDSHLLENLVTAWLTNNYVSFLVSSSVVLNVGGRFRGIYNR